MDQEDQVSKMSRFNYTDKAHDLLGRQWVEARSHQLAIESKAKLREELQRNLQIIRDRKKLHPMIEASPDLNTEEYFERLERIHAWEKVFGYLTNPSDRTSAFFTCKLFQMHVAKKRTTALLPKMLSILQNYNFLMWYNKIHAKIIGNLRLVSKSCKEATDNVFFNQGLFSSTEWYLTDDWSISCRNLRLKTEGDIDEALEALKGLHKSSSSLFKVLVLILSHDETPAFHSKLMGFLDIYGTEILGLKMWADGNREPLRSRSDMLLEIMTRVPNLKALNLHWEDMNIVQPEPPENLVRISLPEMPTLECIYFYFGDHALSQEAKFVAIEVLRKSPNTKSLMLVFGHSAFPDEFLPVLETLKLEHFCRVGYARQDLAHFPLRMFLQLESFFNWPLKILEFVNDSDGAEEFVQINSTDFLRIVNGFRASLRKIKLRRYEIVDDGGDGVVDLPCLKSFRIY